MDVKKTVTFDALVDSSGVSESRYSGTAVSLITPFSSNESSSVAVTPVSMGGINISELSKRIALPPEPQRPTKLWFIIFLVLGILSLISIVGAFNVLIFGPLAVWQGIRYNNLYKLYKEYVPYYEKAIISWDKLYYCFRDDIVLNPETNEYTPPENIYTLINNDINKNGLIHQIEDSA